MPGAAALAFAVGLLIAAQGRFNGQLGHVIGDGILAAVISFSTGLLIITAVVLSRPGSRHGIASRLPEQLRSGGLRWWQLLGGLGGATLVASQGLTIPALGVALFTVLTVAGTTGSSLLVDRMGLGPGGKHPITAIRVVATVGTTLAVALAVSGRFSAGSMAWAAVVLTIAAGIAISFQQAINGQVAMRTGDPFVATLVNFIVGTSALAVVLVLEHTVGGHSWAPMTVLWSQPYLLLGGPMGVVFVVTSAIAVRPLGVLLFSLISIGGQLAGSLISDVFFPTPGTEVGWHLVTGVLLTGVAVTGAARAGRRPKPTS